MLIPPRIFSLVSLADKDATRYALGGVRFERDADGTARAIATDGRGLAVVTWPEDDPNEFPQVNGTDPTPRPGFSAIIPVANCKDAAKLPPKKFIKPILENVALDETGGNWEGETPKPVTFAGTDLETGRIIEVRPLAGRYPHFLDCVPKYADHKCTRYHCDPAYLADLAKLARGIATDEEHRGITLHVPHNPEHALKITASHGAEFTGILMPLKGDDIPEPKTEELTDMLLCREGVERRRLADVVLKTMTPAQINHVAACFAPIEDETEQPQDETDQPEEDQGDAEAEDQPEEDAEEEYYYSPFSDRALAANC